MTIKEIQERMQRLGVSYEEIAYLSGIPVEIVRRVFNGELDPDESMTGVLELVLEAGEKEQGTEKAGGYKRRGEADYIREARTAYQTERWQGEYTIEDYFASPEGKRVELIDGVIYDIGTPKLVHQKLCTLIERELDAFIGRKGGDCISFGAPVSTQLDRDDRTMLEPDITVVCDRSKLREGLIYGAPDLVIEVLSRSTARRDKTIKKMKYQRAGVREYWMVDPWNKKVYVYYFEKEDFSRLYDFEDQVPVGIFDGECVVDFAEIYKRVSFFYEG